MNKLLKRWHSEWRHFKQTGGLGEYGWTILFAAILLTLGVPSLLLWVIN